MTRYRTSATNDDGATGESVTDTGFRVVVANPLAPDSQAAEGSNPEQLLALAWATCLNATAQAIVAGKRRTRVRVDVALRDAEERGGYEFHVRGTLSGEGLSPEEAADLAAAAHARCPVSRLLHAASTVSLTSEPYEAHPGVAPAR